MAVLTPFFDVVAGVAILAGRSSLLDRGVFKTANTNFTVRHLLALGFIGYGGWNLWKIERAQDKLKKSLGAESCDDLCTQCEWCDTCIDGVCENVEEEWGRESADFNHLCRQCHDEHIEELGMNAEDYTEIGICDYGLVCDQNIPTPLNEYGICQDCQEQWEYENEMVVPMNAESFSAEKGIGWITNPASIGKGLPDFWYFDVESDQVNFQTCLTCTKPLDYEVDEDLLWDENFHDDAYGVLCKSCDYKYEYRDVLPPPSDGSSGWLLMGAESFGADSLEDCKKRLGIAEEVLSMSDAVQTYNKYLLQDMGIDRYADDDDDLAYCPRCGLNPNYHQPLEQQRDESDHVKEHGVCNYCMEDLIDEGGEEVALQFDEGRFSFNAEVFNPKCCVCVKAGRIDHPISEISPAIECSDCGSYTHMMCLDRRMNVVRCRSCKSSNVVKA